MFHVNGNQLCIWAFPKMRATFEGDIGIVRGHTGVYRDMRGLGFRVPQGTGVSFWDAHNKVSTILESLLGSSYRVVQHRNCLIVGITDV